MKKQLNQVKSSEDKFKLGDIIIVSTRHDGRLCLVSFGRIRRIKKEELIIKLIRIPKNFQENLLRNFFTCSISSQKSNVIRKYWIVKKRDAIILLKAHNNVTRFDYKSLITLVQLKYSDFMRQGYLKI